LKKFIISIGVAALAFGLAACGQDAPIAPPPPPATVSDDTADDTPAETDAPAVTNGVQRGHVRDLEGRTIYFTAWWDLLGMYSASPEPSPETASNIVHAMIAYDNMRRVEQDYNVYIANRTVPFDDVMPMLTSSVMAGDPFTDVLLLNGAMTLTAIVNNLILPASAYTTPDADLFGARNIFRPFAEWDGEVWSFNSSSYYPDAVSMGVNLDIINAIGAENPVDLLNRGEWTWHNFREIMLLATRDTTGDGVVDQFGISGQPGDILTHLIASNDGPMVNISDLTYAFDHPNTMAALEFMYDIVVTDRTWFYDVNAEVWDWGRNFWSFQEGRSAFFLSAVWALVDGDGVPFEFAIVPFPVGPDNSQGYTNMSGFGQALTIPVGVPNPRDVYHVHEQMESWARDDWTMRDEGMVEWVRSAMLTEEDVWRQLRDANNTRRFDIGMSIAQYYWVSGDFVGNFIDGTMTVSQAVEHFRQPQQDLIDAVFR